MIYKMKNKCTGFLTGVLDAVIATKIFKPSSMLVNVITLIWLF